jgi:hypothetical protein
MRQLRPEACMHAWCWIRSRRPLLDASLTRSGCQILTKLVSAACRGS